jgi:hypothetical protein
MLYTLSIQAYYLLLVRSLSVINIGPYVAVLCIQFSARYESANVFIE